MPTRRGTKWQGDARKKGYARITFDTEEEAKAYEANPAAYHRPKLTVEQLFRFGYDHLWRREKNSRDAWGNTAELIKMLGPKLDPNQIDTMKVRGLVKAWRDKGLSDKRINRKLTVLRMQLKEAIKLGYMTSPMPDCKGTKEEGATIRELTNHEIKALRAGLLQTKTWQSVWDENRTKVKAVYYSHSSDYKKHTKVKVWGEKYQLFFDFLLHTGMRFGEAKAIRWTDVSGDMGYVRLRAETTKSGKSRVVPLTPVAQEVLRQLDPNFDPWAKVEYNTWNRLFNIAKAKAGLGHDNDVVGHSLRHTCASRLVELGVDPITVQKWLGHSDITTTMIYAKMKDKALFDAAKTLDLGWKNPVEAAPTPVPAFVPIVPRVEEDKEQLREAKLLERLGFS